MQLLDHGQLRLGKPRHTPVREEGNQVRQALATTLAQVRPHEQWNIDIVIDDLRDADAPVSTGLQ